MAFAGAPPESIKVWFHRPFANLIVMYIAEGLLAELILLVQWFGNARHTGISDGFTYLTLAVSLLTAVRCFGGLLMMYLLARADRECGDRLFRTSCFWYGPFRFFPLISLTLVSLYLTGAVGVVLFRQVELDQMDFSACSYFLSSYLLLAVNTLMVMFHLFFFRRLLFAGSASLLTMTRSAILSDLSVPAARDSSRCVICQEDLQETDNSTQLPCGHVFHQDCIEQWLRRNVSCPLRCNEFVSLRLVGPGRLWSRNILAQSAGISSGISMGQVADEGETSNNVESSSRA